MRLCEYEGCDRRHYAKGYCDAHYKQVRRGKEPSEIKVYALNGELLKFLERSLDQDTDVCIDWPYGRTQGGYGMCTYKGRMWLAHRLILTLAEGPPPDETLQAAHNCGNRGCVNPQHLRWATAAENQADRIDHGTKLEGECHPSSKLTESDVIQIRSDPRPQRVIAADYAVRQTQIGRIKNRQSWRHL